MKLMSSHDHMQLNQIQSRQIIIIYQTFKYFYLKKLIYNLYDNRIFQLLRSKQNLLKSKIKSFDYSLSSQFIEPA